MAGRPPLEIGTHGKFTEPKRVKEGVYEVRCRVRDADGVTRPVKARGATGAKATAALRVKLRDRSQHRGGGEELGPESTVRQLSAAWSATLDARIRAGDQAEAASGSLTAETVRKYRDALEQHVNPNLGSIRLRELTTQRVERFLTQQKVQKRLCRTVLMSMVDFAVRMDAM